LESGEKVVLAQAEPSDPRPLAAVGELAAAAAEQGRLSVQPLSAFLDTDERAALLRQAFAEGYPRIRLSIDSSAAPMLLSRAEEHLTFERTVDHLCQTNRVSFMCQADRRDTAKELQRVIVRVHATGLRQQTLHTHAAEQGVGLRGELDAGNAEVLELAVECAPKVSAGILRLDLSEVTFIDAAACGAILAGTRQFRSRGGRVILVDPQPEVLETLDLLEADADEGMVLLAVGAG
jgi:anti-anti-sigma factor